MIKLRFNKTAVWRRLRCLVLPSREIAEMRDLIKHMDIHSNYPRNGYAKMTRKEQDLFNRITRSPFSWENVKLNRR